MNTDERRARVMFYKDYPTPCPAWIDRSEIVEKIYLPIAEAIRESDGDGWQPIETAPKDWTTVIVFDPDEDLSPDHVFTAYFDLDIEIWCADRSNTPCEPTHWQPLPEPPK